MKRLATVALLLFATALPPLYADDIKLEVVGVGVKQVYVADKLPFFVKSPVGGALYQWTVPDGVKYDDLDDQIKVKEAPNGKLTFTVRVKSIDKLDYDPEKKAVTKITWKTDNGLIEVNLGGVAPVDPVDPTDPEAIPPASLVQAIKDAYAQETGVLPTDLATYSRIAKDLVKLLENSGNVKTSSDFLAWAHKTMSANLSVKLADGSIRDGEKALPKVREAAANFLDSRLNRQPGAPADNAYWSAARVAFSQLSQAAKKASK